MQRKKESYFWTSYSDLMTSLFFIMLVLFILTVVLLNKRMQATATELAAIKKVVNSTKELNNNPESLFVYKPQYKKYVLNVKCFFDETKTSLADMQANSVKLRRAGIEIRAFLNRNVNNQYMMIIEGQASRNSRKQTLMNYDYSFRRALTLMSFWKDVCKIDFGSNCEIQIAGSGDGRYNFGYTGNNDYLDSRFNELDSLLMRERGVNEKNNQRFVIHIIPKNIIEDEKNN
jgi:hypothetical protein